MTIFSLLFSHSSITFKLLLIICIQHSIKLKKEHTQFFRISLLLHCYTNFTLLISFNYNILLNNSEIAIINYIKKFDVFRTMNRLVFYVAGWKSNIIII